VVVSAIVVPVAVAFLLGGPSIGLPATAAAAATIVVIAARSRPFGAMEVARSPDRRRRVLVVASRELSATAAERVAELAGDAADVRIVVPTPSTRLSRWLSAEDRARERGQDRLARSAGALTAAGLRVSGSVGDSDPIQAVEDELRSFAADEVVVLTAGDSEPQTEELRGRLALPLTTVET
jgi:hypothetical protein